MAPERKVPISRSDFSIVDSEFNSIRERFDQEMKKMEDEMAKFRSELLAREQQFLTRTSSSSISSGSTTHKSEFKTWIDGQPAANGTQNGSQTTGKSSTTQVTEEQYTNNNTAKSKSPPPSGQKNGSAWMDDLHSPLIQETNEGSRALKLRFDVSQYAPEEIIVKTVDNKLQVHAKHEEKTENRSVYREYNREFLLPQGTNPETIKSSLSKDGILTVESPLPALTAKEHHIPIQQ